MTEGFQTPLWVCKYMVSLIPDGVVKVLEPTPGQGHLAETIINERKYIVVEPDDFWQIYSYWDCIIGNPPHTPMQVGYQILQRCMDMTGNIIMLMPWLTIINSDKRARSIKEFGLVSVTHLPRSAFRGARVQTCILQMQSGFRGETKFHFLEKPS